MSLIKEKGAPGRYTKGSVGDKYIDLETGNEYLCTFSFGDSNGGSKEYSWKLTKKVETKSEKIPELNFQKNNPENNEGLKSNETVEELKSNETVEEPKVNEVAAEETKEDTEAVEPEIPNRPNRNNYSKHYKPNKK